MTYLKKPDASLCLESAVGLSRMEIMDTLRSINVVPLKRDIFEKLDKTFIIPRGILIMFREANRYAMGVLNLKNRLARGLLVARKPAFESLELDHLSLYEYDDFAQEAKMK